VFAAASALAVSACATLKAPSLQVEKMSVEGVRLTGATLNVNFRVQNPNKEPLQIERFEYDLRLNNHRLGRGYFPDALTLDAFRDDRIRTRFNVNMLNLPGTVKAILEKDRVRARVTGKFYVRRGDGLKTLRFDEDAEVDLER
jgi:LEA14-like dessication related protein